MKGYFTFRLVGVLLGLLIGAALPAAPVPIAADLTSFRLPEGFVIECVASEPVISQPVYLTFDARGRMWVVQYRQFPFPAGLKVVGHDRYWRVQYDAFPPPPPPHHVPGADKVTILEDTDGDGSFETCKDFVTGLNICTAALPGRGGVWVMNPPYLLFYPDLNQDDHPDTDPIVHLEGFGMEDLHAVANSLTWGPDGWLYGLQGSTCTAAIRRPGLDREPQRFSGQCIWRYHPETRRFELFAEGGFNNFALAVDRKGRMFTGTNSGKIGVHYVQGGYYQKNWGKHGSLTNPYAFGFFPAMTDHSSRVKLSQAMTICETPAFPDSYQGKILTARVLQQRIDLCELREEGSTYSAHELATVFSSTDQRFRPVDLKLGPDGALYVADWYDSNVTWNVSAGGKPVEQETGRIYRIRYSGGTTQTPRQLSSLTSRELLPLLAHPHQWQRQMARRILGDRKDRSLLPDLRRLLAEPTGQLALESLWALKVSGGLSPRVVHKGLGHPDPDVRLWSVRLLGDDPHLIQPVRLRLMELAAQETHPQVRSQLACTARRLPPPVSLDLLEIMLANDADGADPHVPLLLWWVLEQKLKQDRGLVMTWLENSELWSRPLFQSAILPRLGRRFTAERSSENLEICARLIRQARQAKAWKPLVAGMDRGLAGDRMEQIPVALENQLAGLWTDGHLDPGLIRFAVRLGSREAVTRAINLIASDQGSESERRQMMRMLAERKESAAVEVFLEILKSQSAPELRAESLAALQVFSAEVIAIEVLKIWPELDQPLREKALSILASRIPWTRRLLTAVEQGRIAASTIPLDIVIKMEALPDPAMQGRIRQRWGALRRTPGQLRGRIKEIQKLLGTGPAGNVTAGKTVFDLTCARCHVLFQEGKAVGPELTGIERHHRENLLQSIVDPNGSVLPEFMAFQFTLGEADGFEEDEQIIVGFIVQQTEHLITIVDAAGNQVSIARQDIAEQEPHPQSIMPEGLLDVLSIQQIRDLFAYLQSDSGHP